MIIATITVGLIFGFLAYTFMGTMDARDDAMRRENHTNRAFFIDSYYVWHGIRG